MMSRTFFMILSDRYNSKKRSVVGTGTSYDGPYHHRQGSFLISPCRFFRLLQLLLDRILVLSLEPYQLSLQVSRDLLIARLSIQIVHFCRILLQIVQFPFVNVIIEMDELVTVRTHAIVTLDHMLGRELIKW